MSQTDMDAMMYKIEGRGPATSIGTSEHSMIGRFIDQILPEEQLPQTLTSYSPCFRKEKGSHGIEERGVYRIHQFEKQEMIVVCKPEDSPWTGMRSCGSYSVELFRISGHPRPPAGVLLRRPGRPEGQVLRHRGLEPPPAEVLRGLLLLQPGRRPGPPPRASAIKRAKNGKTAVWPTP